MEVVVVRYGEIALKKGETRRKFEEKLMENIRKQTGKKCWKRASRILCEAGCEPRKVMGVVSYSPAVETDADVEEITRVALGMIEGRTFAVRTQRVTKEFPMTSVEVNREVGARIAEKGYKVDLENPDTTVGVEIIGKKAYVFTRVFKGPGGLPVGVEGKAVLLLSGVDSAVAGYLMMRRGVDVIPVHVGIYEKPVESFWEVLREYHPESRELRIVKTDFNERAIKVLKKLGKEEYMCLLCKRNIYETGKKIAEEEGALAIITGESVGQVASQTLKNLSVLDQSFDFPVLRPLVGMDKEMIESLAREIGLEWKKQGVCPFKPRKPKTRASLKEFLTLWNLVSEGSSLNT